MDHVSTAAEQGRGAQAPAEAAPLVVAAVSAKESRWFLERGTETPAFPFVNLGRRGWKQTADELRALNPAVLITCWSTPALDAAWLASPDCRLRYVCHLTGSVRHVIPRAFLERGGLASNWGSIPAAAVAEQALLLALAALRNLPAWRGEFTRPDDFLQRMERLGVRTLLGRRVGIHGFGQVARALVRLLAPFGVEISAFSAGVPPELFSRHGVRRVGSLKELFAGNHVVFECEALTPRTAKSVGAQELAALPDGGVFVNVARSGLVDDVPLLQEARSGRLSVALDVFTQEPLPPDSPWLTLPGVVLSPHIAGPTFDQYAGCAAVAFANVQRFLRGETLEFVVTPEIYDRST